MNDINSAVSLIIFGATRVLSIGEGTYSEYIVKGGSSSIGTICIVLDVFR
jgi:hypothetical protein